jgi:D-galactarolactone cycloisomerase
VLRVEGLRAFPVRVKAGERLEGGTFSYEDYQSVLVRASVDGVEGWGEAMSRSDPRAPALLVDYLASKLAGKEFPDVKSAWDLCWRELRVRGHTRGTDVEALSGIEIALHDCLGKLLKKPLSELLTPRPSEQVPVFAGSLFESRGPLEGQIEAAKARGLRGAKVKIGFGAERDREILGRVRRLWGEGMVVADANGAYDAPSAAKACEAFSGLDLAWFEEPVPSDDLAGYEALKGSGVRIGGGESWFADDFDLPLARRLVGVLEPSVSRCGGIGVEVEVGRRAVAAGVWFSPMTGMNSAVSLAASLHVASAVGSVGVEYNPFPNPLQTDLAAGLGRPEGGRMKVPTRPGLGIDVDARFVRAHSV